MYGRSSNSDRHLTDMKRHLFTVTLLSIFTAGFAFAADDDAIEAAMKYAHKAPKGEKKIGEKIIEGTATEDEIKKTLELYKAAAAAKPPKGDEAAYKQKFAKLITATEDVLAKKPNAQAEYKSAVNCKACHTDHKPD